MQAYDNIIIGGGHNGLICATYLAQKGQSVLLLEATDTLGGLASTREFHPDFRVPVAHSLMGKGALSDGNPFVLGMTGFWGTELVNQSCLKADTILAIGTRFKEADCSSWYPGYTFNIPETKLIHIDIESSEIGRNYPTEVGVIADANSALIVLNRVAREMCPDGIKRPKISTQIKVFKEKFKQSNNDMATSDKFPMMPERILADTREAMPDNAIITTDVGWNKNGVGQQFDILTPGSILTPGGFATMGFGPPAAIGAKIANPDRVVISLVGDGGFGQNPAMLATAVEQNLGIVWIVMNNNAFGTLALGANTTGASNTAMGGNALDANTTASNNTAVGYVSLGANTTAANGTAVGANALQANTTGADNTGLGKGALASNTTAAQNTAVGVRSMEDTTTGDDNTAIGWGSLTQNTTGTNNTALGRSALATNTVGTHNTAVGTSSLATFNVGSGAATFNTAVGAGSGNLLTTGINNTLIGAGCGDALTDADTNVAVGAFALTTDTKGSKSVAIGHSALEAQNFTSSANSDNTAVGDNCGKAVTTGTQNTLVGSAAGQTIQGGGANTVVGYNVQTGTAARVRSVLIGSNFNASGDNAVRIGTSNGTATLALDGSDTSWAAASDERLKKDVTDSTVGLSFINALRPVTFKWNAKNAIANTLPQYDADSSDPVYGEGKAHHGFIAQEVKAVIDANSDVVDGHNLWNQDPDGTQQVAPSALVPMLVKAMQEQSALITALTARITTLEG